MISRDIKPVPSAPGARTPTGQFVDFAGDRYYVIRDVDRMPPFFMSVISGSDHWLFVSSTGGLTAGRTSPETALFPYLPVDKIHDSGTHTGPRTVLRALKGGEWRRWEPFNREQDDLYSVTRNLYKNILGTRLCFEEINHDLDLLFRYAWVTSDRYGLVRECELRNLSRDSVSMEIVDGLQNILPANTPAFAQTNSSNLVDAYKWTELDEHTGLAVYALYSGISDRAEPCESLSANTVFSLGLETGGLLISSTQLEDFRRGTEVRSEVRKRGTRGAYFVCPELLLPGSATRNWTIVADIGKTQNQVVDLMEELGDPVAVSDRLAQSIDLGSDELARIVASADGFQAASEENVTAHHYANTLFNILRGGVFNDQYRISRSHLGRTLRHFNRSVYARHRDWLEKLPSDLDVRALAMAVGSSGDPQLERLCHEYLPITFGRRHGDPSRPWNKFTIKLRDEAGRRLLSYEGNWRDIFQNWEALAFSFPEFIESIIAKFVNASTADGHNPYRITSDGIDWEVEDKDDPWSYIGYWGDHQIIYLLKFLEMSRDFHPALLAGLLRRPIFSYANVPYRIAAFDELVDNPKSTVRYDHELADCISRRVKAIGADGKLVLDEDGEVYRVNLIEKLLVPLLAKMGNFVLDGGIWLNTQRPEWNDANNALVGHGLSMVTLYHLRRYVRFLLDLLKDETDAFELSEPVARWLSDTAAGVKVARRFQTAGPVKPRDRYESLKALGMAASRYRQAVYNDHPFSERVLSPVKDVTSLLDSILAAIDHCVRLNRRKDGIYHAYNLLELDGEEAGIGHLYLMLEGQVAALSSGAVGHAESIGLLEALFDSDLYRPDQRSFMLYPDRQLPGFLEKNRVPADRAERIGLLRKMLDSGDTRILSRDARGDFRFSCGFTNIHDLDSQLDALRHAYGNQVDADRNAVRELYESVFNHHSFTGRSGGMFGFEGLGCIYWHMVSKLLLAVQEKFYAAAEDGSDEAICKHLGELYYQIRDGLGFNKSPAEYGAFPTDPYSHTPGHAGAQQPGMTGQVKEEVLSRFGELGVRVRDGQVRFHPQLLRQREFLAGPKNFRYLDVDGVWQELVVPESALAFTWCQVPIVYRLEDDVPATVTIAGPDGVEETLRGSSLNPDVSSEIFRRSGKVRRMVVSFPSDTLVGY